MNDESKSLGPVQKTPRNFEVIYFKDCYDDDCSLQQSSAILPGTPDAWLKPGTSGIWLGVHGQDDEGDKRMHLARPQVEALVNHLNGWLGTGSFEIYSGISAADEKAESHALVWILLVLIGIVLPVVLGVALILKHQDLGSVCLFTGCGYIAYASWRNARETFPWA